MIFGLGPAEFLILGGLVVLVIFLWRVPGLHGKDWRRRSSTEANRPTGDPAKCLRCSRAMPSGFTKRWTLEVPTARICDGCVARERWRSIGFGGSTLFSSAVLASVAYQSPWTLVPSACFALFSMFQLGFCVGESREAIAARCVPGTRGRWRYLLY